MYIVLEGIDGAGKSCQAKRIADRLEKQGYSVQIRAEPKPQLKHILERMRLTAVPEELAYKSLALLYAADRIGQKYDEDVDFIISARSYISSLAYQEDSEWIRAINKYAKKPDYVFFLDVDPEVSVKRSDEEESEENIAYLEGVRQKYLKLSREFPGEVIATNEDKDGVLEQIMSSIKELIDSP